MSVKRARQLRRNATDAERKLWYALRDRRFREVKFRRQWPIGRYVADFVTLDSRLIIEVDGSQHDGEPPERAEYLESQGFRVIRFWNNDVLKNLEGVLTLIDLALRDEDAPNEGEEISS